MEVVKAILYELQPFRLCDVRNSVAYIYHASKTIIKELIEFDYKLIFTHFKNISPFYIMLLVIWLSALLLGFGSLAFMTIVFVVIFQNMGDRKDGEMSAYSVFNRGYHKLLGQMTAEQFDQEIRHHREFNLNHDVHEEPDRKSVV